MRFGVTSSLTMPSPSIASWSLPCRLVAYFQAPWIHRWRRAPAGIGQISGCVAYLAEGASLWEGWQQMFWTCGHYPLTPWTYVWLNPPYLEERSQIRCGILGWFAACSVRAVCWMNSGWIELRTIHQMEFSTEMWGPCAPNDFWIFDPLDPQSFVRSMACHFHTAFCHACEACVRVFCRHYLNVGDILTESGHILADLWKNWCYGCLCRFLFNHFNPLTSSNIFSPEVRGRVQEGSTATLKGFQNILYMFIFSHWWLRNYFSAIQLSVNHI